MLRLFRWLWKLFILASVFGIGYIIGREHSFEEDEDWEDDKDLSFDKKDEDKKKDESKIEPAGEKKADSPLQPKASETPQNASQGKVSFEYVNESATHVSVVGPFNEWNKDKHPLKLENGKWKLDISLATGRYEYKFVVNHTDWIADPKCPETMPDKHGGRSSVIQVH